MKRIFALWLAVFLGFYGGVPVIPAAPALALETEFRQLSGGQAPDTQRQVEAGMEEAQLQELADRWFEGPNRVNQARQAVRAQARELKRHRNEVLTPPVVRPASWPTPAQLDDYWAIQAPVFGTGGGGGTAGVQMPIAETLDRVKEGETFAIVAVDDSGGDAGKRRPWTVIAVGDWRNGVVNRLSDALKDLGSARLSKAYGLKKDPPKKVKDISPGSPFSFREAFEELAKSPIYRDRIFSDPRGLWMVHNTDILMAVLDRVVLNRADALREFPELEQRIESYRAEGRIGSPEAYRDYPILKGAMGNLMVHAVLLTTGATLEPKEAGEKRRLDPERVKQAEWLLERSVGLQRGHTLLAGTEITERYGVFSGQLPRSVPNADGAVLIGRLRAWNGAYDPEASDGDKENRQVLIVHKEEGTPLGVRVEYLDDSLQPTDQPRWRLALGFGDISERDLRVIRSAAGTGTRLMLQGYAIDAREIFEVDLVDGQVRVRNLATGQILAGEEVFPDLALSQRIAPRSAALQEQGLSPTLTMIRGEDNYEEADTWHGNDLLAHEVQNQEETGSWIVYHGHEGDAPANPEAVALIDSIPAGGLYVIGPGSDGTSLRAVHSKQGIWQALEKAVERGVTVLLVAGISYDTGTHGVIYLQQLEDWQLDYRIATNNPKALLGQAITHVAMNQLPPLNRSDIANRLDLLARDLAPVEADDLEGKTPVSTALVGVKNALLNPALSEVEVIQALSEAARLARQGAIPPQWRDKISSINGPRRRVLAERLRALVEEPSVRLRAYLLSYRLGGLGESGKFRGPRQLKNGESQAIESSMGIQVIERPLVVVNTELRSDRGITQPETTARSDRAALGELYKPFLKAEAGMEEPPAIPADAISPEEFVRQAEARLGVWSSDRDADRAEQGVPFILAGTQTDSLGRPGLAYGLVLYRMGFQVGFVVEDQDDENLLKDSGIPPWRIARIDNVEIFTPEQAVQEIERRALEYRISIEAPVQIGVSVPISQRLQAWLEDLDAKLPAEVVRTAEWLISEASAVFA